MKPNNEFITCCDSSELKFPDTILVKLQEFILHETTRKNFRLAKGAGLKLAESNQFIKKLLPAPQTLLRSWTKSAFDANCFNVCHNDMRKLDVQKGIYEGGFKIWEATNDLVDFIVQNDPLRTCIFDKPQMRALELGCGSGLASLSLIARRLELDCDPDEFVIHVQDYNWEVLAISTLLNLSLNLPSEYLKSLMTTKHLRFYYGNWDKFKLNSKEHQYDLIIMSETLYDYENYQALHDLLDNHLASDGFIVIATKDTYFGLTGSIYSWIDFVERGNKFTPHKIYKIPQTNIPRSILVMHRRSHLVGPSGQELLDPGAQ